MAQLHIKRAHPSPEEADAYACMVRGMGFQCSVFKCRTATGRSFWEVDIYGPSSDAKRLKSATFPPRREVSRHDWTRVNWSKSDAEIAALLGCRISYVRNKRKMFLLAAD